MVRLEFFGATLSDVFSFAFAANSVARFLSDTGSTELIRSAASGPRISRNAATSKASAARRRVSAASFAELNCFCFFECAAAAESDFRSGAARNGNAKCAITTAANPIAKNFMQLLKTHFAIIVRRRSFIFDVLLRRGYRRRLERLRPYRAQH